MHESHRSWIRWYLIFIYMNVFKQIVKRLKEDDATTLDELALRVDMLPTQITETIFKLNSLDEDDKEKLILYLTRKSLPKA